MVKKYLNQGSSKRALYSGYCAKRRELLTAERQVKKLEETNSLLKEKIEELEVKLEEAEAQNQRSGSYIRRLELAVFYSSFD